MELTVLDVVYLIGTVVLFVAVGAFGRALARL